MEENISPLFSALDGSLWAILPEKLSEIGAFLTARMNGEISDLEALAKKSGNRASDSYQVQDGVAILPLYGTISKRMNLMTVLSGGTSGEIFQRDFRAAQNDPSVSAIVIDIESPGGTVDGTPETASAVFDARGKKPVVAYANGVMASAAYWIGSAADEIVTGPTAQVGSLSVAGLHVDRSARDAQAGIKRTMIATGPYKRIASDEKPLSAEGESYLLGLMQPVHEMFADAVANHRGMNPQMVRESVMNGRVWTGQQAVDMGLADRVGTLQDAVALARQKGMKKKMDPQKLKVEHPAVYQAVYDSGAQSMEARINELALLVAGIDAKIAEAKAQATEAERARIVSLIEADADAAVTLAAIKDGTPAAEAFQAFYVAEREARTKLAAELPASLPGSVGAQGKVVEQTSGDKPKVDFMAAVKSYATENKCSEAQAVRAVQKADPKLHAAWLASLRGEK